MNQKINRKMILFYLLSFLYILSYVYFEIAEYYFYDFYAKVLISTGIKLYVRSLIVIVYFISATYIVLEIAALPKSKKILDILWIDIPAVLILTYPIWHYPFSIYIFRGGDSQFLQIIKSYWLNLETSRIMFREGSILIGLEIYRYIRYKKRQ